MTDIDDNTAVMEDLTGDQNVVNLFGFLKFLVLTEYLGSDLAKILKPKRKSSNNRTWKGIDDQRYINLSTLVSWI